MRDPNRINEIVEAFSILWHMNPDMRFGQILEVIIGEYNRATGKDPFFVEDNVFLEWLNNKIKTNF